MTSLGAIVLAGGGGTRLGGVLKPAVRVGGARMIDHVLTALAGADPIVVVAPDALPIPPAAIRIMEDPPGGGPVAAIGAALPLLAGTTLIAVVAGDMPLLRAADIVRLADAAVVDDGALFVDETGRAQWLCGVWRTTSLIRAIDEFRAARSTLSGGSLRALFGSLRSAEISSDTGNLPPFLDCDTEDDIRRAEEWLRQ